MNTETANGPKLVAGKPISNTSFINLITALSPQLILSVDESTGAYRYNEDQLSALLGYNSADYESTYFSLEEILHPDDRAILLYSNADAKVRLQHKDGTYLPFSYVLKSYEGIQYIIATLDNEQGYDDPEQALAETVSELQRSNKELEEFAYIASHDLQEPLRKISTFASRLAEKFPDQRSYDDAQQYISRICSSAENMRVLINNLLDFSRITRVNEPLTKVNLNVVLREVRTDLELMIEESGLKIQAENLPHIEGRFSQMKQLVHNIITNTIKFHKPGQSPAIEITASSIVYRGKPFHKLLFCDNGIGFEEQYASRIFQIFQRLHGKAEYPGSGIGLAICKKIVEHHGGEITATNIAERGACFTVLLPALS